MDRAVTMRKTELVATGRAERRSARVALVERSFSSKELDAALDLLELLEIAWHDCYGEPTPPEQVIDDALVVAGGSLAGLIRASRLALTDWRDLRVTALEITDG